jgi:hypothetical protein
MTLRCEPPSPRGRCSMKKAITQSARSDAPTSRPFVYKRPMRRVIGLTSKN